MLGAGLIVAYCDRVASHVAGSVQIADIGGLSVSWRQIRGEQLILVIPVSQAHLTKEIGRSDKVVGTGGGGGCPDRAIVRLDECEIVKRPVVASLPQYESSGIPFHLPFCRVEKTYADSILILHPSAAKRRLKILPTRSAVPVEL